jgi:hypothetical protein
MVSSLLTYCKCQMAKILTLSNLSTSSECQNHKEFQNPLIMYSYTHVCNLWEDELQMPQITLINKQQQ